MANKKAVNKRVAKKVIKNNNEVDNHKRKEAARDKREPLDGVEYNRISGAMCMACKMPGGYIRNTLPWKNDIRIRYHVCRRCGTKFKSVEID